MLNKECNDLYSALTTVTVVKTKIAMYVTPGDILGPNVSCVCDSLTVLYLAVVCVLYYMC